MANTIVEEKPISGLKPEKFDDDTALLDNLIDSKPPKEVEEKEPEEEKPEEDLLEEDKDLLDEKPEDDLLEDTNLRAVDLTKIKEKYPDFAKTNEFRELRNAYHREAKYTELFPTLEDAKEAAENNETFTKINTELMEKGDPTVLLGAIRDASPEAFKKVATSFLDTVSKMDEATYVQVISPVVRRLAKQIHATGQKDLKNNPESNFGKALVATARNIMQYAFEDADEINKDEPKVSTEPSAKEVELTKREEAIATEKFQGAYQLASHSVERNMEKAILQGLDPDNKFNEFTRDTLIEKINKEVQNQMTKDTAHVKRMDSLWSRAAKEGYSRESLSRIVAAYLERARPIIPTVRNKFRSIAIKGRASTEDTENEDKSIKIASRGRTGRSAPNDGKVDLRRADPKKIDYRNTTDDDIFEGKVSLKK